MNTTARYVAPGNQAAAAIPAAGVPARGSPLGDHDLDDYGFKQTLEMLSDAGVKAVEAGRLPKSCALKIADYMKKAVPAGDWSPLSGGERQWLNQVWQSLVFNETNAPVDCLMGAAPSQAFDPQAPWVPPPNDPEPPEGFPWGWVIGAGVLGMGALYWFVLRNKPRRRKKR